MRPRIAITALMVAAATLTVPAHADDAEAVDAFRYTNDFEQPVGVEWSSTARAKSPVGGRNFLGEFTNAQSATLTLYGLPPTSEVTVSFDLLALKSWDGINTAPQSGPDIFELGYIGGPPVMRTTFSNSTAKQSYPGEHPTASNDARTGAVSVNTLGYPSSLGGDSVYRVTKTFAYTGPVLMLRWAALGSGPASISDESWGLDNVDIVANSDCGAVCVRTVLDSKIADVALAEPGSPSALASASVEFGVVRAEMGSWWAEQGIAAVRSALLPEPEAINTTAGGLTLSYRQTLPLCVDGQCSFGIAPPGGTGSAKIGELWNGRIQVVVNGATLSNVPAVVYRVASN